MWEGAGARRHRGEGRRTRQNVENFSTTHAGDDCNNRHRQREGGRDVLVTKFFNKTNRLAGWWTRCHRNAINESNFGIIFILPYTRYTTILFHQPWCVPFVVHVVGRLFLLPTEDDASHPSTTKLYLRANDETEQCETLGPHRYRPVELGLHLNIVYTKDFWFEFYSNAPLNKRNGAFLKQGSSKSAFHILLGNGAA